MLDEAGIRHDLTVFESGKTALNAFQRDPPPDLIVSDWRLAEMEFAEFIKAIRAIPAYESTAIVVVTGLASPVRQDVLALGAICCLEKPVKAQQLLDLFSQIAAIR
jgi:CheY-like chemotaxis protein